MQFWVWIVLVFTVVNNVWCCLQYKRSIFLKTHHIAALVLARGGSKGVILKNLQKVGNKTLLGHTLEQIKKVRFDSIWVSTDHILIAGETEKFNVNIHWRSPETATDEATSLSATKEFLTHHPEVDIVALIQCTSPFLKKEYLENGIKLLQINECAFSVSRSFKLIWKNTNGKLQPLNFDPKSRPRRQDFDALFVENGMFYFSPRKLILNGYFQSNR